MPEGSYEKSSCFFGLRANQALLIDLILSFGGCVGIQILWAASKAPSLSHQTTETSHKRGRPAAAAGTLIPEFPDPPASQLFHELECVMLCLVGGDEALCASPELHV